MSSEIELLALIGHDIVNSKYYSIATAAILFYDYFLTLDDEIEYAWSKKKPWAFWLFFANRYFPMTYQFLYISLSYGSSFNLRVCNRIAWYFVFSLVTCTFLAQVVLTLRIWAVTAKNTRIVAVFAFIAISQFVFGFSSVIFIGRKGAEIHPAIPLDAFRLCVFTRHRTIEIVFTSLSLLFDSLAFSMIMYCAAHSRRMSAALKVKTLLETVAEDAMLYFLVIFTAHVVLEMTLIFGKDAIQLLPGPGIVVYLPVMISRIMLSLKKAARTQQRGRSNGEPSSVPSRSAIVFQKRGTATGGDDIPLESHSSEP